VKSEVFGDSPFILIVGNNKLVEVNHELKKLLLDKNEN